MQEILPGLGLEEVRSTAEVVVKYVNLGWTNNSEGILLVQIRQSGMKARVAKGIRYRCSPSSKHCTLNIGTSSRGFGAAGKPKSVLPWKYSRKAQT